MDPDAGVPGGLPMQRVISIAFFLIACLLSPAASAQATTAAAAGTTGTQRGFSFCTITDMSGGGMGTAKIWASPIFEFAYRANDPAGFGRTQDIATEFHTFIGGMGGAGDKACFPATRTRAELEAIRDQQRADWTKRTLVWASKWQEVAWSPKPWDPTVVVAAPASVDKYFYCYVTDVEPNVRKTVASLVFSMPVAGDGVVAGYQQANDYAEEFKRTALIGQGVSDTGTLCSMHDTLAEAEKSRKEYRRLFSGFNLRFVDLPWRPSGNAAATPPAAPPANVAPASPAAPAPAAPTPAVSAVPAAVASPLAPAGPRKYCHAYMQSVRQPGGVRSPVWEEPGSDGSVAAMTASLTAFIVAVRSAQPEVWHEFPPVKCYDNSGYCVAMAIKRLTRNSQIAGQFCEPTLKAAEDGRNRLAESDNSLTLFPWPRTDGAASAAARTP